MKICPNCGKENQDTAKFCVYCGFSLANVAAATSNVEPSKPVEDNHPVQENLSNEKRYSDVTGDGYVNHNEPNESGFSEGRPAGKANFDHQGYEYQQPGTNHATAHSSAVNSDATVQYKSYFMDYLSYLKNSIVNPVDTQEFPKYAGFVSLVIYVILVLGFFKVGVTKWESYVHSVGSSEELMMSAVKTIISDVSGGIMKIGWLFVLMFAAYFIVSFAVRKVFQKDEITIVHFADEFGVYLNISAMLMAVNVLLSLTVTSSDSPFASVMLFLFIISQSIISIAAIMTLVNVKSKFNKFYAVLISQLVPVVIMLFATNSLIAAFVEKIQNWVNS
ncbi:zinc ribbon domain-containing protein [Lentilactobacillus sp. Marseille-Q4993]|uniref:zinc ribbon domain-containing protein n=1 Tax=Lentilactobacillus sp. Marseille-Q4993 TaxID=3039492 RepID=UPI0024BD2957|nr:zinc ribbon domain-containing protein [Lentilactobacillus sp. Marseille-Q4993]